MAILVTGGSGFVGSWVIAALTAQGERVVATTTGVPPPEHPKVTWVRWDALQQPLPDVGWGELEAIIHLAAPRELWGSPNQNEALFEVLTGSTLRLLNAAQANQISRFLLASTGDVLGSSPTPAIESNVMYEPRSFYGTAKACAELLARSYSGSLTTTILRLYHPYGPRGDRFLINRLVERVRTGQEVWIDGEDGILLNPIWAEDLGRAVTAALRAGVGGVLHLGGPDFLSLREFLVLAGQLVGMEPRIRTREVLPDQRHAGSIDFTNAQLGIEMQVGIRAGLERLLAQVAPGAVGGG